MMNSAATAHTPLLALRAAADEEAGWPWCPEDPAAEIARLYTVVSAGAWIALGGHFWHGHVRPHGRETAAETLLGAAAGRAQFPTPAAHRHFLFGLAVGLFTLPPRPQAGASGNAAGRGGILYNPDWYREVLRLSFSPALFVRIRRSPDSAAIAAREAVFQHARAVFWAAVQVPMPPADRAFVHRDLVAPAAAAAPPPLYSLYWSVVLQAPVLMPAGTVGVALAAPFTTETLFYLRCGASSSCTLATRIADYVVLARLPIRAPSIPEATGDGTSVVETAGPLAILDAFAAAVHAPRTLHSQTPRNREIWNVQRGSVATGGSVPGMRNRGTVLVARIIEAMPAASSVYAVLARASQLGILHGGRDASQGEGWIAVLAYMLGHLPAFPTAEGEQSLRYCRYRSKLLSLAGHCGTAAAAAAASPSFASTAPHLRFPPCPGDGWRDKNATALWKDAVREFCATLDATPTGPAGLKPAKRKRVSFGPLDK